MPDKEKLMKVLLEEYGIATASDLEAAIMKQSRMDISIFVTREDVGRAKSED